MPGAGSKVLASDTPAIAYVSEGTDEAAFTNTTFTAGTTPVGTTFIAPTSGVVLVFWGARLESNVASRSVTLTVEVREGATIGAGTVVSAASDDSAVETPSDATGGGNTRIQATRHRVVTGLTPNMPYNIRTMHRMFGGAGNGDIFRRDIAVLPVVN